MPTVTTLPLLILIAVLWHYTRGRILSIVIFTSIFDAASALNFGQMGVSPWLLTLVLCLALKALHGHRPFRFTAGINSLAFNLMLAFIAYAVWSGLAYPFLFHGIPVTRAADSVPLQWSVSNLAQICYLLAAAVVYLLAVSSTREDLQSAVDWYIRGCVVASLFAMYQLANAVLHIPYPDAILYSNTSHVVYRAYKINGMWRLNSTFTEASSMAGFLTTGLALLGWAMVKQPLRLWTSFGFIIMLVSILMSVSSTGYVCLILIMILGGPLYVIYRLRRRAISPWSLILMVTLAVGAAVLFIVSDSATASVNKVISSVLLNKKNSDSYRDRQESHVTALATFADSYYMGAGWGSIRASGLTYTLLGTVGVIGLTLFVAFYVTLFLPFLVGGPKAVPGKRRGAFEQSLFGATILLCGLVLAGSEPTVPILWVLFGVGTVGPAKASMTSVRSGQSRPTST